MPATAPHFQTQLLRLVLTGAAAVALGFAAADADAQRRGGGGGHGGGKPGWSGGGGGGWQGSGWRGGGHGGGWSGHGSHWRGHGHHRGPYHGGHYYYPGWALGLGVGIGLTYPWWGWYPSYGYPATTVVYERVHDAPVGVVVERNGPLSSPAPAAAPAPEYRWYCPSPAGYHPDVRECQAGWLKVLPDAGSPPPALAPRSRAPSDDFHDRPHTAPGTVGSAVPPRIAAPRIAAPRIAAPAQLAVRANPAQALAHLDVR